MRQFFVTCNALQCWWSQLSSKVVGLNQLFNCKVDCHIHCCAQSWDCLSRSLSWSNMRWFITKLLVIEHAICSCSFARYCRGRAILLCDLHRKWTRSFTHSRVVKLLCSCDLVAVKTMHLFMHSRAIKLLCSCDLVAVKTTCLRTSSQPNHANTIIIVMRQKPDCISMIGLVIAHALSCSEHATVGVQLMHLTGTWLTGIIEGRMKGNRLLGAIIIVTWRSEGINGL
jgi:hypothetical protein